MRDTIKTFDLSSHGASTAPQPQPEVTEAPPLLKIKDIMTADVFTVEAETSADEATWGLTRRHIGGAPVHDGKGALVGVLTKGDLLNPEPGEWIKGKATVADVMSPDVLTLYADDPALFAAIGMVQRNIHRVVVMDASFRLAGIVTAFDIVKAVAAGLDFTTPPSLLEAASGRR